MKSNSPFIVCQITDTCIKLIKCRVRASKAEITDAAVEKISSPQDDKTLSSFINSSVGLGAKAKVSQYAATKHALKALADSLREEVNPEGVRILSVFPGRTATPMQELVHKLEVRSYHPEQFMQPEDIAEMVIHALSLPRTAEVTDIHIRPMTKT